MFIQDKEEMAVQKVIEDAYIKGIHGNQDEKTVKSGFHKDFAMLVLKDMSLEKVNVDQWLQRIEEMKKENPELWKAKTTHNFLLIDVTGSAAAAKLDVFKGKIHFSTDYMLLYKFGDGWKIVSKVFTVR